jgi:DNA-binding NarL/FixJ family response regulator
MSIQRILIADTVAEDRHDYAAALRQRGLDVETVASGTSLVDALKRSDPDLVILACNVMLADSGDDIAHIRAALRDETPVLILASYACRRICARAWRLPVVAWEDRQVDADWLGDHVVTLLANGRPQRMPDHASRAMDTLTDRERTVLSLVCNGLLDREIGECLEISVMTVHTHVKRIINKLGARNRTEAAAMKMVCPDFTVHDEA